jgi:hypothetical protein
VDSADKEHPFLVARPHGKGNVLYVGSGELWRLRTYRPEYHEKIWWNLAHYAAPEASSFTPQSRLTIRQRPESKGETVVIEARLFDKEGGPIDPATEPVVRVTGAGRDKKDTTLALKPRAGKATGWYEASVLLAEPGDYTLAIVASGLSVPLSTKVKVKSFFEIQVGDGELLARQRVLSGRTIPWSVALLSLAKRMSAAKGDPAMQAEAQLYRDAIQSTVADRWSVRHEALIDHLRRCPERKLGDLRAAHDESRAISEGLRAMRLRLFGKEQPETLAATLQLLRKCTAAEDAIESALAKAEPARVEEQMRLWAMLVADLTPEQAKLNADQARELDDSLWKYGKGVEAAHDQYYKALRDLGSCRIRPETMRFLEERARESLKRFQDPDLKRALEVTRGVQRMFAKNQHDEATVRMAHAQIGKFRIAVAGLHVDRVVEIFEELIQLELDQREQSRVLAELCKQLEAELLRELSDR